MILDDIVKSKMEELARRKRSLSLSRLKERVSRLESRPLDFAAALKGDGIRLIAEVKKASPSRGVLSPDIDPARLAKVYAQNGAAAISVLTEERHFDGRLEELASIKAEVNTIPILRKDFVFEPYQIYESRAYGADALLLITSILSSNQLEELLLLSHGLGMKCLVEVHCEEELERALASGAEVIGINNRDLKTFKIEMETTKRLRPLVPKGRIVVSESGINRRSDVDKLRGWGVDAVLVGEALVMAEDVAKKMGELL